VDTYRKEDGFWSKEGGRWVSLSHDQFLLYVEELFFALRAFGVKQGDRVAIMSENRVEWAIADYAALALGAVTVPLYPTLSPTQIETLLRDSQPVILFVSTASLIEKLRDIRGPFSPRYVVAFDRDIYQPGILRLDGLYDIGKQLTYENPGQFRRSCMAVGPDDVATIIYTSGTSGTPKGAMLTHRNMVSNIMATRAVLLHDCVRGKPDFSTGKHEGGPAHISRGGAAILREDLFASHLRSVARSCDAQSDLRKGKPGRQRIREDRQAYAFLQGRRPRCVSQDTGALGRPHSVVYFRGRVTPAGNRRILRIHRLTHF
jgi:acyl-CoA synthetase (AMP-forming)/AMP-acid ligase II